MRKPSINNSLLSSTQLPSSHIPSSFALTASPYFASSIYGASNKKNSEEGSTKDDSKMIRTQYRQDISYDNIRKLPEDISSLRETYNTYRTGRQDWNPKPKDRSKEPKIQSSGKLASMLRTSLAYSNATQEIGSGFTSSAHKEKYQSEKQFPQVKSVTNLHYYQQQDEPKNFKNKFEIGGDYRKFASKTYQAQDQKGPSNYYKLEKCYTQYEQMKQKQEPRVLKVGEANSKFGKKDYVQYYTPKVDKGTPLKDSEKSADLSEKVKPTRTVSYNVSPFSVAKDKNQKQFIKQLTKDKKKKGVSIDDFIIGKNLGQGRFGTVYMVKHRATKSIYALKKILKSTIKSHMLIDQFVLELKIQSCLVHPYILKIYGCFDDKTHIYLVLEFMEQGTLYNYLKKHKKLPEIDASSKVKYVAEAITCLHQLGIAHRDIKPQNIVMSNDVCKLCDFGWATFCDERRKTYCGTPDYVAPQIVQGIQYDMSVDLWCLGVLAYELITGKAPFYHYSRKQTMKKIINVQTQSIQYPSYMSNQSIDFIKSLIRKNPEERKKGEEILKHGWLNLSQSDF